MSSLASEPALRPSVLGHGPALLPAFRRTAAACQNCQSMKTRCDRKTRGSPCTNCRLDNVACVLGASTATRLGLEKRLRARPRASHHASSSTSNASEGFPSPGAGPLPLQTTQTGLPHFIKPLPSHLATEDREFFRLKGVFEIPGASARSEILRCYFQSVYPLLPLLDLESFLGPMTGQHDAQDRVSLVLFYAVMCSGATHVDIQVLQSLGYETRKSARRAFFERARLLYDFDCEPDQVSLVQAFLLMTYWYDTNKHGRYKDGRFWIREAVTLAQDLDLDLELYNTKSLRLLKRLWWCCFMRDQFVALMTWTPPQLRYGSQRPPVLDLSDFEVGELSDSISHEFSAWTLISSKETRIQLAMLCIEKAKLCQSINKILHVRYASLRHKSESQITTILVPKYTTVDLFDIVEYDRELQKWYQSLPDPRAFDLRDAFASAFVRSSDLNTIHRAHLKLLFLSTLIALRRTQVSNRSDAIPVAY